MTKDIKVGTLWESRDFQAFRVTALEPCVESPVETWVCYQNILTKQEYRCWLASFVHRFTPRPE